MGHHYLNWNLLKKFKCNIQYNGTNFNGFQCQPDKRTVETELRNALSKFIQFENFSYAGRTDSGVHALGQVIVFSTSQKIEGKNIHRAMTSCVSKDINVMNVEECNTLFHARKSAKSRTYKYLFASQLIPIYVEPFITKINFEPVLNELDEIQSIFKGKHDFIKFRATGSSTKTTIRTVNHLKIRKVISPDLFNLKSQFEYYEIEIQADGFLYKMVRNIVGAIFEILKKRKKCDELLDYLNQNNDNYRFMTAKAKGLCLVKVNY